MSNLVISKPIIDQADSDLFEKLDLEPIKYKLMHPHDKEKAWSLEKCDKVASLYKMYLQLCKLYSNTGIVPTHDIDEFWHQHILDTLKYQQDCQTLFGYFLHHYPYFGLRGAEDELDLASPFENTRALFIEHFNYEICLDNETPTCRDDCISLSLDRSYIASCAPCQPHCVDVDSAISKVQALERPRPVR
jgi:hypothetical protein